MAVREIFLLLAGLVADAATGEGWICLRSRHFEVYSEGTEAEGRVALARLEQAHAWLAEAETPVRGAVERVRIVAFASEETYAPYRLTSFSRGYFLGAADGDVLVLSGLDPRRLPLAVHE